MQEGCIYRYISRAHRHISAAEISASSPPPPLSLSSPLFTASVHRIYRLDDSTPTLPLSLSLSFALFSLLARSACCKIIIRSAAQRSRAPSALDQISIFFYRSETLNACFSRWLNFFLLATAYRYFSIMKPTRFYAKLIRFSLPAVSPTSGTTIYKVITAN